MNESESKLESLTPATDLEKLAGSLGVAGTLTSIAAMAGGPLAALLPVLTNSLAAERQKIRVENALAQIDQTLKAHSEALRNLTDSQYKLLNEVVLALLHSSDKEKIEYLRRAVHNTLLKGENILPQESVVLSRIIRDISAAEADFLIFNFHYDRIQLATNEAKHEQKVLTVPPNSDDGLIVTGLVSLGLLTAAEPTYDDSGLMRFSPIVAKLLVLLSNNKSKD